MYCTYSWLWQLAPALVCPSPVLFIFVPSPPLSATLHYPLYWFLSFFPAWVSLSLCPVHAPSPSLSLVPDPFNFLPVFSAMLLLFPPYLWSQRFSVDKFALPFTTWHIWESRPLDVWSLQVLFGWVWLRILAVDLVPVSNVIEVRFLPMPILRLAVQFFRSTMGYLLPRLCMELIFPSLVRFWTFWIWLPRFFGSNKTVVKVGEFYVCFFG